MIKQEPQTFKATPQHIFVNGVEIKRVTAYQISRIASGDGRSTVTLVFDVDEVEICTREKIDSRDEIL